MSGKGATKLSRVSRSRRQWLSLIEQFESSGVSKSRFCRDNGVPPSSFGKALRRLRGASGAGAVEPSPFVALSLPEAVGESKPVWDVELQLSAETVLRLRMR